MFTQGSVSGLGQNTMRKGTRDLSLETFLPVTHWKKQSAMPFVQKRVLLWETNICKLIITIIKAYLTPFWYQAWWHGKQLWVIYFPAKPLPSGSFSPTSTQDTGHQQLLYWDLKNLETVSRLKALISLKPVWLHFFLIVCHSSGFTNGRHERLILVYPSI